MTRSFDFSAISQMLGKPDYESGDIALYNRDCITAMKALPRAIIDLTVTSPPYNIGKEYETPLSLKHYLDWSKTWIEAVHGITRPEGAFWLNLGYLPVEGRARAMPIPYLLWDRIPFFLMQEIVWHYGAGVSTKRAFAPRNEKFLWFVKSADNYTFNLDDVRDPDVKYPNQKKNGKLKCNPLGKNPSDVWIIPKVTSGENRSSKERTSHPAQFPSALIERIILACSNDGDLILDPFMGSGTTAVVASRLGRRVIGFELSREYVQIAIDRIEGDIAQQRVNAMQAPLFSL